MYTFAFLLSRLIIFAPDVSQIYKKNEGEKKKLSHNWTSKKNITNVDYDSEYVSKQIP